MTHLKEKLTRAENLIRVIAYCTDSIDRLTIARAPAPIIISRLRVRHAKMHQLVRLEAEIKVECEENDLRIKYTR